MDWANEDYGTSICLKVFQIRKSIYLCGGGGVRKQFLIKIYNRKCHECNAFIPLSCKIGSNVLFPHGLYGIFISQGASIGNDCCIFQQVTIGSNTLPDSKKNGAPIIGDNVFVGAGAKIIGGITVGNNVRIGANAIITKNIPDNTTVIGINNVISYNKINDNTFISYKN